MTADWRNFKLEMYTQQSKLWLRFPVQPPENVVQMLTKANWKPFVFSKDSRLGENTEFSHVKNNFWIEQSKKFVYMFAEFGARIEYDEIPVTPPPQTNQPSTEKIINQIKKLLALAESANENEASVAAAKAQEMMMRYNLTLSSIGESSEEDISISETTLDEWGRHISWRSILITGVSRSNYCDAILVTAKGMQAVKLIGRSTNASIATSMYEYLAKTIDRLALQADGNRGYKNSFRLGCASRIAQRLLDQMEAQRKDGVAGTSTTDGVSAIVVKAMTDKLLAEVKDYMRSNYPRMRSANRATVSSSDGFAAGKAAGDRVSLNKQVGGSGQRYLPG